MQVLCPPPIVAPGAEPWLTVGDFGGQCKLTVDKPPLVGPQGLSPNHCSLSHLLLSLSLSAP